jgi:uncharacterized protein YndB with AHSA1/START domain
MIDVSAARPIPAPPEAVWPLLDDPAHLGEWFAFADRGEVLEGEGVGRRQRMHGRWGRKRSEIDQVVTSTTRRTAWRGATRPSASTAAPPRGSPPRRCSP